MGLVEIWGHKGVMNRKGFKKPGPRETQQSTGLGMVFSLEGVDEAACWARSGRLFGTGMPALLGLPMCSLTRKHSQPYFTCI